MIFVAVCTGWPNRCQLRGLGRSHKQRKTKGQKTTEEHTKTKGQKKYDFLDFRDCLYWLAQAGASSGALGGTTEIEKT